MLTLKVNFNIHIYENIRSLHSKEGFGKVLKRTLEDSNNYSPKFSWASSSSSVSKMVSLLRTNEGGKVPWRRFVHSLVCTALPSICSLEGILQMKRAAYASGRIVPMGKKSLSMGMTRADFLASCMWFEEGFWIEGGEEAGVEGRGNIEGNPSIDATTARDIKDIYATMFAESDETVNYTDFLLTMCSVVAEGGEGGEGTSEGKNNFPLGLYRAFQAICNDGASLTKPHTEPEKDLVPLRSRTAGPNITQNMLDLVLSNECLAEPVIVMNAFKEARDMDMRTNNEQEEEGKKKNDEPTVRFDAFIKTDSGRSLLETERIFQIVDLFQ